MSKSLVSKWALKIAVVRDSYKLSLGTVTLRFWFELIGRSISKGICSVSK